MWKIGLTLLLLPMLFLSCTTYPTPRQLHREDLWNTYVPNLKRISVDIQTRAGEVEIVDKERLTRITEEELKKTGIEVIDHTAMVANPIKGDGIYFFSVPRYGGGGTHVWFLVWSKIPGDNLSEKYHWGYTGPLVFLELLPRHNTDEGLRQQYQDLVQSTAKSTAEAIIKARTGR